MVDLSGDWNSYYRYPSGGRGDDFWGQHTLRATRSGNQLTLESGPESASCLMMELEVSADGSTAKGVWAEDTDPNGYYKGRRFEGTIELKVAPDSDRMSGIWHGAGRGGVVHSDVWELVRSKTTRLRPAEKRPRKWRLTHWYPSADDSAEESDEHVMTGYWSGDTLVLESAARPGKSYLLARLRIQGNVARGNWQENAPPEGEFKGAEYTGAGELVVDPKTLHMEGMWAGAGYDHALKKTRIYTGKWEIVPINEG